MCSSLHRPGIIGNIVSLPRPTFNLWQAGFANSGGSPSLQRRFANNAREPPTRRPASKLTAVHALNKRLSPCLNTQHHTESNTASSLSSSITAGPNHLLTPCPEQRIRHHRNLSLGWSDWPDSVKFDCLGTSTPTAVSALVSPEDPRQAVALLDLQLPRPSAASWPVPLVMWNLPSSAVAFLTVGFLPVVKEFARLPTLVQTRKSKFLALEALLPQMATVRQSFAPSTYQDSSSTPGNGCQFFRL